MTLRALKPTIYFILAVSVGWVLHEASDGARSGAGGEEGREITSISSDQLSEDAQDLLTPPVATDLAAPAASATEEAVISVYEERNAAVVNITTETVAYNWFLEAVPQEGSTGSGSIIDDRGYVLTNYHVVDGASRVFVTLANGDQLVGDVVGADAENDLAVVKFDPEGRDLDTIPMGNSDTLRVGQHVMAIGNPFGLDRTLTTGIVSGLGRPLRARNDLVIRDMIQTDASINPGNSGGPLLDSRGRMVGIATMIFSPSGGSVGIGFAVPVNTARRVVPDLIEYGVVRRGWIDIIPRPLFPRLVEYAQLPRDSGLLVSEVVPGGNAEDAGLRGGSPAEAVRYGRTVIYLGGDIITAVDGVAVASIANLYEALEDKRPGDVVSVEFVRDGDLMETRIRLSERPSQFQWD